MLSRVNHKKIDFFWWSVSGKTCSNRIALGQVADPYQFHWNLFVNKTAGFRRFFQFQKFFKSSDPQSVGVLIKTCHIIKVFRFVQIAESDHRQVVFPRMFLSFQ